MSIFDSELLDLLTLIREITKLLKEAETDVPAYFHKRDVSEQESIEEN